MDTRAIINQIIQSLDKNVRQSLQALTLDHEQLASQIENALPKPEVRIEKEITGTDSSKLLSSLQRIRAAENQKQVIAALVDEIASFCRACSIIILGKQASLWIGPGMGLPKDKQIGSLKTQIVIGNDSLVQTAVMQRSVVISNQLTETENAIYKNTKTSPPDEIACIPMTINGRVQGIVIADTDSASFSDTALFSIMTGVATIAVEQLPFREKIGFSNFPEIINQSVDTTQHLPEAEDEDSPFGSTVIDDDPGDISLEMEEEDDHQDVAEIAHQRPPEPEEQPDEVTITDDSFSSGESLDDYARELESQLGDSFEDKESEEVIVDDVEIPEIEDNSYNDDINTQDTSEIELATEPVIEDAPSVLEIDTEDLGESEIEFLDEPEPVVEDSPAAITKSDIDTVQREEPVQFEEEEEEEIPVLQDSNESLESGEASPAEYYDNLSLSGYNLDQYQGEEHKQHEKAIRFARLLVSEIKLYNEDDVKKGRENKDLLKRLKDDIQRSQVLYEQRIPQAIRNQTNYFQDEMVRQLANGDPALLG